MKTYYDIGFLRCALVVGVGLLTVLAAAPAAAKPAKTLTVNAHVTNTSIGVSNTRTTPLFVDTGSTTSNGFNASCSTGNVDPTYGQASCTLLTIPAGRQVVIETVSCQAEVLPGRGPADVQLIVPNPPLGGGSAVNVSHMLTLSRQDGNGSVDIRRTTTPLRAYGGAPASGSINIGLFFRSTYSPTVPVDIICAISGYMVGQ